MCGVQLCWSPWELSKVNACVHAQPLQSCPALQPHGLQPTRLLWDSAGKNTGVGSLSLVQGIFPTQGLNPGLPHCKRILYQLRHKESPRILEWVAFPFSRGSSQPRNWTRVSCIASLQGFPGGSEVKVSACNAGDPGSIPGQEDPLEKEITTHSSILAWKIPWREEPGRLQFTGSQSQTRLSDFTFTFSCVSGGFLNNWAIREALVNAKISWNICAA